MPSKHKDHKSKSNIGSIVIVVIILIVIVIGYTMFYNSSSTSSSVVTPPVNNNITNNVAPVNTTPTNITTTNTSTTTATPAVVPVSPVVVPATPVVSPIAGNLVKNPINKCIGIDKSTPCGNLTSDHCKTKIEEDGTLSIYSNGVKIWSTKITTTDTPVTAVMQDDANFVIYSKNKTPIWSTGTFGQGTPPYQLILQDDCNLVLYQINNQPLWASGTNGK